MPPEQPEEQLPPEPKPEGGKGETIEMQEMSTLDPEFVSEIRGGPTPFLEDTSPMLIDDIPTGGKPFSFNDIDWEKVSKPTIDSLGDYFESDAGIDGAFLGSEGIGQNLGLFSRTGFQNFLKQRMTDIARGSVTAAF